MLHSKKNKVAALILALVMVLGLAACGGSGNQPQSGGQVNQPPVSDSADNSEWYGLWASRDEILEIQSDFAMLYQCDTDARMSFNSMYGCVYRINGNVLELKVLSEENAVLRMMELTMDSGRLVVSDATPEIAYTKLSDNSGSKEELSGVWYTYGIHLDFPSFQGDVVSFNADGTCTAQWREGSDAVCNGTYSLTSKEGSPAICISVDGQEMGTYAYWFAANDLLRLYTDADKTEGFLLYRPSGAGSGSLPQSGVPVVQTPVSDPTMPVAPVQSEPVVTNPPAVSSDITGIWREGPAIFAFHNDYALAYEFGSGDDGDLRFGYLKHLYDGSYTLNGSTLSLSLYELDGTPVHSGEFTLDGNTLSNGSSSIVKVSGNTGIEGDLAGTWHSLGDEFRFGAFAGTQLQFYNDGTYRICQEDGSGQNGGSYVLTSQYDLPAVTLCDQNGNVIGTYCYEFLENDLLMIYVYDVDFGGYVFYRAS